MLGHVLTDQLSGSYPVVVTHRRRDGLPRVGPFAAVAADDVLDVGDVESLHRIITGHEPANVVNCAGVVKQDPNSSLATYAVAVNALWPHQVAEACDQIGARLIQISTDCVFSGTRGGYSEGDIPDPIDTYGRSKLLGEVVDPPHLTLRTSLLGRQLSGSYSLFEWFASCEGQTVNGYSNAFFSGPTTYEVARIVEKVIANPDLTGLYHVGVDAISKYDLLKLIGEIGSFDVRIVEDPSLHLDRSLRSAALAEKLQHRQPDWRDLITELIAKGGRYENWRHGLGI